MPTRIVHRAAGLLTALIAAGLVAGCDGEPAAPAKPKTAVVAQPQATTATRDLHETGVARAMNRVDLLARVSGALKSIDYKDGAEVKAGQRLFLIEPELYEAQVAEAEASLKQSDASFGNTQGADGYLDYSTLAGLKAVA